MKIFDREAEAIADLWTMTSPKGNARCRTAWTHELGYELRVYAGDDLRFSQVHRRYPDLEAHAEELHKTLAVKGWSNV